MARHVIRCFSAALLLLLSLPLFATHQRAGEISYTYVSGLTYEFTIVTYTYTPSLADRPEIDVYWGDGTYTTIQRSQKINLGNDISRNVYVARHTFPASGSYHVTFEDPNRNAGIINIPSSVEIPFFIETIIVINPFIGGNSSPQLLNPPIDNGCTNVIYYHNPGAYDADGDSLSYSLINCRGTDGEEIPGYSLPYASNSITIDPITGDLIWNSPTMAGEYNVAILIEEWRNGIRIGSMIRDMQISIAACNNRPPEVEVQDTCVTAGTRLHLDVLVKDNTSTRVTLSATGEPLYLSDSPAQFMTITDSVPYHVGFTWNTNCNHIKQNPYTVLFKAQDNGPQVELVSFKRLNIRIVAPKPEILVAVPQGNTVTVYWHPDSCPNAIGYEVYRRDGSNPFEPDYCETGMPSDAGYSWVGSTSAWTDTAFLDDGSVLPLYHANEYCYRVVALFPDGSESYVSDEVCVQIANDAPIITHADVLTTDDVTGTLMVRWIRPPEVDSAAFPPPYHYHLYRKSSADADFVRINAAPIPLLLSDTSEWLDHDLNTSTFDYTYYVEFRNDDTLVEKSDPATSIYLQAVPSDRKIRLSWNVVQPWHNVEYVIFRYGDHHQWDSVGCTRETSFEDHGLENGREYSYYVRARGYYWVPDTLGPFYNRSQRAAAVPVDDEPPQMPEMDITTDCLAVIYSWRFDSDTAESDARHYYFYYKPTLEGEFQCVDSLETDGSICYPAACTHTISSDATIVGCFAMAVADTNGNKTRLSDSVCFDVFDCLDYRFPNVFTPNGDGTNDLFEPYPPYYGVVQVDMRIYNRWGRLVFRTSDPDVRWNGTDSFTGTLCGDGVYYYSCDVIVNTLSGQVSYPLHGSVTIIR